MICDVRRPGTYSIVARDPDTLELGVAVQSHWFSVGSVVPWLRPGVGAAAVQSVPVPGGGPRVLELLEGMGAQDALRMLVAGDDERDYRQLGVVDAHGGAAVHSGAACIPYAGDASGAGYTCQANIMRTTEVWGAMSQAFEAAGGPLAERLVWALEAGEEAGGGGGGRRRRRPPIRRAGRRAARGRGARPLGRPARRGPLAAAGRARAPARPPPRLRAGGGGRRAGRPGPPRRGRDALRARGRARAGQRRARLLGGPGRCPGGQ